MKIELIRGDITKQDVDAIVNAANSGLMGGGGVDGAIHRAAGPELVKECEMIVRNQGQCNPGEAVITKGYKLKAKYVIHTVGPIWYNGTRDEQCTLEKCYLNSLSLADKYNIMSIAFPNISTGIYGYPKDKAVEVVHHLFTKSDIPLPSIELVRFVCFDEENYLLYSSLEW